MRSSLVLVPALLLSTAISGQELTPASYARWRSYLAPKTAELGWRKIPWHQELRLGLEEARRLDKPVLLWAMNGHPLGCT